MHGDCHHSAAADLKMKAFCVPPKFEFGSCSDCAGGVSGATVVGRGPTVLHNSRFTGADQGSRAAGAQIGLDDGVGRQRSLATAIQ